MKLKHLLSGIAAALLSASTVMAAGTNLVIVEAYGGGGNSGAFYKNDFIGLFNRGTTPVDVTGWSVQYNSATGTAAWQVTPLTSTVIPAGGYYLVQEAAGANTAASPLPTPDATGTIAMGSTGFKVALVANTTALTGAIPTGTGPTIVDFVGAGVTSGGVPANGFEGSAPAAVPSNTLSVQRNNNGCEDTDSNTNDFIAAAPTPRNSSTPLHSCAIVVSPVINGVTPSSFTTNAGNAVTFTVSLSQGDAPLFYQWYTQSADTLTSTPIANATNSSLTLPSVLGADSTNYVVVVTNNAASANSVTSAPVTLTVIDPALNSQPVSETVIPNGNAQFRALAGGTAITYQWYYSASPSDNSQLTTPVANGLLPFSTSAGAIGATSNILTITNVTASTQTNFALVVTGTYGSITSSVVSITLGSTAVPLAFWNFNDSFDTNSPAPYQGIGTAAPVSVVPFVQPTRDGNDTTPGNNFAWGTQTYPSTATVSNKQTGVQFNVSTVGAKNIMVSFDARGTATASKYQRLQYTTNGTDFIDYPASQFITGTTYNSYLYNLTGFPGVANNPNFGIRIVAEFESTALYNNTNDANYVGVSSGYGSSGTLSYDIVKITGDAIVGNNHPPTVTGIPATVTVPDLTTSNLAFTVTDDSTPAGSLTVNATSLDPNTSVAFNPVNTSGAIKLGISPSLGLDSPITLPVLVTVTDGNGDSTANSFLLTVTPANSPPVISGLVNTNMLTNTVIAIPFTLTDDHTVATSLTPSITSSNSTLIPNDTAHLSITGSGTNRVLNITPAANVSGAAPLYISVTDGGGATLLKTVIVEVRPNTNVMLIDNFDYDNSGSIINVSGGLWATHSGTAGQLQVTNGVAVIDSKAHSEDVNAPLIGAPYPTNMNANVTLYASYTLNVTALPDATGAYITHFKDNTTFDFFGRVWISITNATSGDYRIGIGNSSISSNLTAQLPQDLLPNQNYTVVVRMRMTNGFCTLWINPTSESSPSVSDTTFATNLAPVYQYAFRESNASGGTANVDNLKVGTSFTGVTGLPSSSSTPPQPTIKSITIGGPGNTNIIITGTNNNGNNLGGGYVVLSATNLTQPVSSWSVLATQNFNPDGSLNFTNGIGTSPNTYYLLQALP